MQFQFGNDVSGFPSTESKVFVDCMSVFCLLQGRCTSVKVWKKSILDNVVMECLSYSFVCVYKALSRLPAIPMRWAARRKIQKLPPTSPFPMGQGFLDKYHRVVVFIGQDRFEHEAVEGWTHLEAV